MNADELAERFEPWRAKQMRTAWEPRIGGARGRSKFGGEPELRDGEAWPVCTTCRAPMSFLLQLEFSTLPKPVAGAGLLQLFYCSTDDGGCETWAPFSGTSVARLVDGALVRRAPPAGIDSQPERVIAGWDAVEDFPNSQEHEALGARRSLHLRLRANTVHIVCDALGFDEAGLDLEECSAEVIASASVGDKLFGWPHWVQGEEYPLCPRCHAKMKLVFQVDSEAGVSLMFGDAGIAHLTQCETHPDVLAFGWACS